MLVHLGRTTKIIAAAALALGPTEVVAGNYGTAGVSDARVGQQVAQGGIWCETLEARIPENLYAEMDCSEANVARPAVANNRITNNRPKLLGIFPRHVPSKVRGNDVGNGTNPVVANSNPTPKPTTPVASGPVGKWDRLSDFGVTQDNFDQQSDGFREQVSDYLGDQSNGGDWSGFNPN